ncbi:ParB/RepB/Spo0J family partition protein [Ferruginivarius sediminum]|uniref:ParB/RepB/Spo0J family partition protein n=1 Tax=Ferruginivarius sediminum TaxID=2661937 RepID=A0A369T557_9PROT|nr:ParB/RepB/Spo0J family partition protein [Ferruginivarius sediminum]RDD60460.1 ParB/RepB/Spo0J family partition protein [Ferruginivarius sediminum]
MTAAPADLDWSAIRARIDSAREAAGFSVRELHRESGAPYASVADWLAGRRDVLELATLARLCGALGLSLSHAIAGVEAEYRPHDALHPSPLNPRRTFSQEELEQLAVSIAAHGLLQPLVVRPRAEDGDWIVAGERRWRALGLLSAANFAAACPHGVPVTVRRDMDDLAHLESAIAENADRVNLNPMEDAEGIAALADALRQAGTPESEITERIATRRRMDRRGVQQRLQIVRDLTDAAKAALRDGTLDFAKARVLVGRDAGVQDLAIGHIRDGLWQTRDELTAGLKSLATPAPKEPQPENQPAAPAPTPDTPNPAAAPEAPAGPATADRAIPPRTPAPVTPSGGGDPSPAPANRSKSGGTDRYRVLGDPNVWVYAGQIGTLVVRQGTGYRLRFDDGAELVFMPHQVERVPADARAPKPSADPKQDPPAEKRTGDAEDREAKVERLRELCAKRPDVAWRLLAVALLQPLERIAVTPGLSARAVTVAGREGELSETIRSRLMAVAYRLPIGNTPVHELSPPGLYDDLSHLDDSEVLDILAELTVARLGPAEAPDSTGHSLLDTVLAIEEPAANGQGGA